MNESNQPTTSGTKLGFICEQRIWRAKLSDRHLILIIFISMATLGAVLVYLIGRCCFLKKQKEYLIEGETTQNFKNTEIM